MGSNKLKWTTRCRIFERANYRV